MVAKAFTSKLAKKAVNIVTSKLPNAALLPGSLILISGLVVWKLWSKQAQLQTETSELSDELQDVKKQVAEIKAANDDKSETALSSTFKKLFSR